MCKHALREKWHVACDAWYWGFGVDYRLRFRVTDHAILVLLLLLLLLFMEYDYRPVELVSTRFVTIANNEWCGINIINYIYIYLNTNNSSWVWKWGICTWLRTHVYTYECTCERMSLKLLIIFDIHSHYLITICIVCNNSLSFFCIDHPPKKINTSYYIYISKNTSYYTHIYISQII